MLYLLSEKSTYTVGTTLDLMLLSFSFSLKLKPFKTFVCLFLEYMYISLSVLFNTVKHVFCIYIFSSPKAKAQINFFDYNLSAVRRCRCCKFFTFSSSFPDPLGQFQPNFVKIIPWWRGFQFFFKLKGPTF